MPVRALLCLLCGAAAWSADPDALDIIRKACEHDTRNLAVRQQYTYRQTVRRKILNGSGDKVRSDTQKVEDVIYIAGAPYSRMLSKDGRALSTAEQRDEQEKMERETNKRKREPESDRQKRLAKDEANERELRRQIPEAFRFKFLGEETVNGRECYRIWAEPKPDFRPSSSGPAEMLSKVRGTIWIDKREYAWVQIEAESIAPFSIKLGLLRLDPGARMRFEQWLVNNEMWAPKYVRFIAPHARAAWFFSTGIDYEMLFYDYRKFAADSRIETVSYR